MAKITKYRYLKKDRMLAELIGIILGDGNLYRHARTENLRIICNSNYPAHIRRIVSLVKYVFHKKPSAIKRKDKNAVNVNLYQCKISKRLGLPIGDKIKNNVGIPSWIKMNRKFTITCLKGLFETDGCFVVDKENYTQIIEFKNNCNRLRRDVFNSLVKLSFNPQFGRNYIRLVRKKEVNSFEGLISFRNYNCPLVQW